VFEGIQERRWPRASNSVCTPLYAGNLNSSENALYKGYEANPNEVLLGRPTAGESFGDLLRQIHHLFTRITAICRIHAKLNTLPRADIITESRRRNFSNGHQLPTAGHTGGIDGNRSACVVIADRIVN